MSFLFHEVVFGPVHSRRLGVSLGINLLPPDRKFCTFNCIYCECGWTHRDLEMENGLPSRDQVRHKLEEKLKEMKVRDHAPDAITFAGNGEPTIHPQFPEIMDDVIRLRDEYFPEARVTVLTNASTLHKSLVFNALKKTGDSILKLDAGTEETFQLINNPKNKITLRSVVDKLKEFNGELVIQSLFLRGEVDGKKVDNTTEEELSQWIALLKEINPKYVMIYPIDRPTPNHSIEKISFNELKEVAEKVENAGIRAQVFY